MTDASGYKDDGSLQYGYAYVSIDPLEDDLSEVASMDYMGDDASIIRSARVSLASEMEERTMEQDRKLMKYLLTHHHMSPFEHTAMTFRIRCPIFVDRQLVRHRIGVSKNEESARYTTVKEEFYVPRSFRQQAPSNRQASIPSDFDEYTTALLGDIYAKSCDDAIGVYKQLLELGVAREQARGVLPLAMYTSSYYTFNVRSLMHFIDLRDHEGAQWETRQIAQSLLELAEPLFPMAFGLYRELKHDA